MRIVKYTFLVASLVSFLIACGPSTEEIRVAEEAKRLKEQALIDSTARATAALVQKQIEDQRKAEEQLQRQKLAAERRQSDKIYLESYLGDLYSELELQRSRFEDLKAPKFLRTASEKEAQLRDQLRLIRGIEEQIKWASQQLEKLEDGEHYNLPDQPSHSDTSAY